MTRISGTHRLAVQDEVRHAGPDGVDGYAACAGDGCVAVVVVLVAAGAVGHVDHDPVQQCCAIVRHALITCPALRAPEAAAMSRPMELAVARERRPAVAPGRTEEATARGRRGTASLGRLLDTGHPDTTRTRQAAGRANSDHSSQGRAVTVTAPPQFQQLGSVVGSRPSTSQDPQYQCAMT